MARVRCPALLLAGGWEMAETVPRAASCVAEVDGPWRPARVPGTVAQALGTTFDESPRFDAHDYWYRKRLAADEVRDVLRFGGLATLADVWIDGEHVLASTNMFHEHVLDVRGLAHAGSELTLRFAALGPALRERRPRPRWRATIVDEQQLRWFRTSLLGRIPSWTPPIAPVGPFRPVTSEHASPIVSANIRTQLQGSDGLVLSDVVVREDVRDLDLLVGEWRLALRIEGDRARGTLRIPNAPRWWPHTHGPQPRLPVILVAHDARGEQRFDLGATGFRSVRVDRQAKAFTLYVNDERVFCRGACWMPLDVIGLNATRDAVRAALEQARDAGMNMLRLSGTMLYETPELHELCDELGILVWQDFMFANMDYPIEDPQFEASVRVEATQLVDRLQLSPSLVVCCGGSEVEQQAAMMGLPPEGWSSRLFADVLPSVVAATRPDVTYVPSSPTGGALPFQVDEGVSHYYGVGAYMRPLEDARRSRVRFTSECLAFANVPNDDTIDQLLRDGEAPTQHPRWKARVARDRGTPWDFEDVRDHYVERLFGIDATALRRTDLRRYLEVSRVAVGEVMASAMSEWRRAGSECAGALVWFLRDLWEGAGWGIVDSRGLPKSPYYYLKRVLAPVTVLAVDEGLNGLAVHAINDGPQPVAARLSVELFRGESVVAQGERPLVLPAHGAATVGADAVIGRFTDLVHAYRFGPPGHDATVISLRQQDTQALLASATHFPRGLRDEQSDVGLHATAERMSERSWRVRFQARGFARAVAIDARGFVPDDDFFDVPPGRTRDVVLTATSTRGNLVGATAKPLNGSPSPIARAET